MLELVGERLAAAIETNDLCIKIVSLTSLVNLSKKRAFEMILIVEDEVIAWVGCWKRIDCLKTGAGAPRVWINNTRAHLFPGVGMDGGFSVKFSDPAKAEHLGLLLQSAIEKAFDSINVGAVKSNRFTTRFPSY